MDETVIVTNIDWKVLLVSLAALLVFIVTVWKKIDFIKEKLGIQTRHDIERKLLMETMENLSDLQKKHYNDMDQLRKIQEENVNQSIKHDNLIKDELSAFTKEIRCVISNTKEQMNEYSQNRIHDREQSLEIQKKFTQSIQEIANGGKRRDVQIEAITIGSRELLGNTLDQKFQKYISLKGIPSDE